MTILDSAPVSQAQALAEGGVADMIARMRTNYYAWVGVTNSVTHAEGGFTAWTRQLTNGNVLITSAGTVGNVTVAKRPLVTEI